MQGCRNQGGREEGRFGRLVKPYFNNGADYAHHTTICPPAPWIFRPSYGPAMSTQHDATPTHEGDAKVQG